jgi:hypothetical protein
MILDYYDVDFVFITKHYDYHLRGLCRYNGELHSFTTDYPEDGGSPKVFVQKLSLFGKLKALLNKKMFEICVGYHWTYKNGKKVTETFKYKKPEWFWRRMFRLYYATYKPS